MIYALLYAFGAIATWIGVGAYDTAKTLRPGAHGRRLERHKETCYRCGMGGTYAAGCPDAKRLQTGEYILTEETMEAWQHYAIAAAWPVTMTTYAIAFPLRKTANRIVAYFIAKEHAEVAHQRAVAKETAEAEEKVEEILKTNRWN